MKYVLNELDKILKEADEAFEADGQIHWGAGWVNVLTGEVVPSPSMRHDQTILARPEYEAQMLRYRGIEYDRQDCEQMFLDGFDEGEHVGWHAWSDNEWDLKKEKVMLSVMADGWVRFGYWFGKSSRHGPRGAGFERRSFEVSGLTHHLDKDQWDAMARRRKVNCVFYVKGA